MAWQNPKTNWSAEDGVRDTDFNRIEGNLLELYNVDAARAVINLYVSTDGSDNGDGSVSSPYATIGKAISAIPRNLNGNSVSINVGNGTYNEDILVDGFSNGVITFKGSSVTVKSFLVRNTAVRVEFASITVTTGVAGAGIIAYDNGYIIFTGGVTTTSSSQGVVANGGTIQISGTLTLSNATTGISATNNGRIYVSSVAGGTNMGTGMTAENGGVISYGQFAASYRTAASATSTGGRINTGSQPGSSIGGGGIL